MHTRARPEIIFGTSWVLHCRPAVPGSKEDCLSPRVKDKPEQHRKIPFLILSCIIYKLQGMWISNKTMPPSTLGLQSLL